MDLFSEMRRTWNSFVRSMFYDEGMMIYLIISNVLHGKALA